MQSVRVGGQRLPSSRHGHSALLFPQTFSEPPPLGLPGWAGRTGCSAWPSTPTVLWRGPPAASLMLFVTQQGSQGDFTVWGRGFRDIVTSLERNISYSSSLSDLATLHWGGPFFSIPHPEAEWSPGQSTKWLLQNTWKCQRVALGLSVSPGSHTVIQSHTQR